MISDLKCCLCRRQDVTLVTDRWTCGLAFHVPKKIKEDF